MLDAVDKPVQGAAIASAMSERLRQVRGFVFDMDGTLVLGDHRSHGLKALPGALELIAWLKRRTIPFVVFTNGTARTPQQYAQKLRELGFDLSDHEFMTPASSAADVFVARGYRRVMVLGGEGVAKPLLDAGIDVVAPLGKQRADAVFAGWFREFSMENLEAACHAVNEGASYYSASQSMYFATADGRALGTSRAISAMVKDVTGCRVTVVGKPSIAALRSAAHRLGARLKDLAVVGDDPALEVPMAHRGRATAISVNSGLGDAHSYSKLPDARKPHLALRDVAQLLALLMQVH